MFGKISFTKERNVLINVCDRVLEVCKKVGKNHNLTNIIFQMFYWKYKFTKEKVLINYVINVELNKTSLF